jgi:hypothetical protein
VEVRKRDLNALRTNGYNLEHNFGHGKKTLASILVALNMLAFAFPRTIIGWRSTGGIDQILPGKQARPALELKGAHSLEATIADPVAGQNTSLSDPPCWQAEPKRSCFAPVGSEV